MQNDVQDTARNGKAHIYPKGCFFKTLDDIKDKHITVMGLGLNGGGIESVRFFLRHGAYVTVTDKKSAAQLEPTLLRLKSDKMLDLTRLHFVLETHRICDFATADCVIKTPAVRYEDNEYLQAAKVIETDISVFLQFCKSPIIAVTGSKGKSTTASLIYYGLKNAGFDAYLGGNITMSPLSFLESTDGLTLVILELSSWQLRDLRGRQLLKPKVAVLTKIVSDHQNWYHSMSEYIADKMQIFAMQDSSDYAVIPQGQISAGKDGIPKGYADWGQLATLKTKAKILRYSTEELDDNVYGAWLNHDNTGTVRLPEELLSKQAQLNNICEEKIITTMLVPGVHNRINALAAACAIQVMKVAPEQTAQLFATWTGIPHRLELFHKWKCRPVTCGHASTVLFYNDSAATVPEAASLAVQAFGKSVIAICGGTDKELDFSPLAKALRPNAIDDITDRIAPQAVYLLEGTGTQKLIRLLETNHTEFIGPFSSLQQLLCVLRGDMRSAKLAKESTQIVVFSPGCTSFGMFENEFDRGDKFKEIVKAMFL